MKYALIFSAFAALLLNQAASNQRWHLLLIWPSISFAIVALAYALHRPALFGKRQDGKIAPTSYVVLFPYYLFLWSIWRLARILRRELSHQQLTEGLIIGRRLKSDERPVGIDHVIDLTCEFVEPKEMRVGSYFSFPVLDAGAPPADILAEWIQISSTLEGTIYLHCAEGRGRTCFLAIALLLHRRVCQNIEEGFDFVKAKRPGVRLSTIQRNVLDEYLRRIRSLD